MNIIDLILTSISLAMDAFSISLCKGLQYKKNKLKNSITVGLYFGFFQFIMPIIGYNLGIVFTSKIIKYNPYISTILLIIIGILMINEKKEELSIDLHFKEMIILAIATSIDALVVGISFSFLKQNILFSSLTIGVITFIICFIGYYIGNLFNKKVEKYSNLISGLTLIYIGIKILIKNIIF